MSASIIWGDLKLLLNSSIYLFQRFYFLMHGIILMNVTKYYIHNSKFQTLAYYLWQKRLSMCDSELTACNFTSVSWLKHYQLAGIITMQSYVLTISYVVICSRRMIMSDIHYFFNEIRESIMLGIILQIQFGNLRMQGLYHNLLSALFLPGFLKHYTSRQL